MIKNPYSVLENRKVCSDGKVPNRHRERLPERASHCSVGRTLPQSGEMLSTNPKKAFPSGTIPDPVKHEGDGVGRGEQAPWKRGARTHTSNPRRLSLRTEHSCPASATTAWTCGVSTLTHKPQPFQNQNPGNGSRSIVLLP